MYKKARQRRPSKEQMESTESTGKTKLAIWTEKLDVSFTISSLSAPRLIKQWGRDGDPRKLLFAVLDRSIKLYSTIKASWIWHDRIK